jgi:DNA-binding transcriptional MocR family regulator
MEDVQIVNGSQQALDFLGKSFLDEGEGVLCDNPTYLAALSAFRAYGPRFVDVATDDEGMLPDDLEKKLASEKQARFIYVIPDFQNPTGRSWSLERRKALTDLADRFGVPVVEDNPYGELRFEGEFLPPSALGQSGSHDQPRNFSKILVQDYGWAWLIAPPPFWNRSSRQAGGGSPASTISQCRSTPTWSD